MLASVPVAGGVPLLSSNPTATAKLYLDFDGDAATTWNGVNVPATPAYDTDGDVATFNSEYEIPAIREIWSRVAEKFSPFNIDVTTVNPGNFANKVGMHAIIGGDGMWRGIRTSGVATVGSFYDTKPNSFYSFPENDGGGYTPYVAESIAHFAGQSFGLENQAYYQDGMLVNAFHQGNAQRAPVMGQSYYSARGIWWSGDTLVGPQDDMAKLSGTNNGFGYRADDHGGSIAAATALGTTMNRAGVIEKMTDADYFSFTTTGGSATIKGDVVQHGATLDLKLTVYNASGAVVASADGASLGETITTNLPSGTYYVAVASHGAYGDVGQYTLTVTAPTSGGTAPTAPSGLTATGGNGVIELRWNDNSSNETGFNVQRSLDNGATWSTVRTVGAGVKGWDDNPVALGVLKYRIVATGSAGTQSAPSNVASFTVKPGDVNLDGFVSGDDYAALDFNIAISGSSGWANGDVNFDGLISGDDYATLDYWVVAQYG